jgi:hypothetical protein
VLLALSAALVSLSFASTAHAALVQSPPSGLAGNSFDDHSIGGDNHMGWSYSGSDDEALAVDFGSSLTSTASAFRVCGYNPNAVGGWMQAFQVAGATCPATAPASGQNGWFRYVIANHDDATPRNFNRWHLMDVQRFALVPVPGSTGHAIAWDNDWGTCLADNSTFMECTQAANAASLSTSIGANTTKVTQEGAPDATRIVIPSAARGLFPAGAYQVVAISNPYGAYSGPSNVACTSVTLSGYDANPEAPAAAATGNPATCYVPASLQAALTGPTGRDPLAGETASTCTLMANGHCWATVPMAGAGFPTARTTATTAAVIDGSGALVTVPQGGALTQAAGVVAPAATAPVTPASVGAKSTVAARKTFTARLARTYGRSAARKVFGRRITRLSATCTVTSSSTSRCAVSFRKSGARYSGRIYLRFRTVSSRVRWQYQVNLTKKKSGKTTHVRRSYRTGGLA